MILLAKKIIHSAVSLNSRVYATNKEISQMQINVRVYNGVTQRYTVSNEII